MTEEEWLTCADPKPMLEFVQGKASDRKLRLFACACCRRLSSHFKDERSGKMVEVSELVADGNAGADALAVAFNAAAEAQEAIHWEGGNAVDQGAAEAVLGLRDGLELGQVLEGAIETAGAVSAGEAWESIYGTPGRHWTETDAEHSEATRIGEEAERNAQVVLLRDTFGNPFRRIAVDPTWQTPAVVRLAQAIYNDRAFDRMPELADGLHDAGCGHEEILNHFQGQGPHVRGCWALDVILGKA